MVYVSPEMMKILDEKLEKGTFTAEEFANMLGDKALRVLIDLYCQGLLDREEGDKFIVTDAGRRLVIIWRTCGRPTVSPWIDSRVLSLIEASVLAGGRVEEAWIGHLLPRGFVGESGELSPEAYEVLDIFENVDRRLVVSRDMAEDLLSLPEGPVSAEAFSTRWLDTYEAMDIIVRSSPEGNYISMTRVGRFLRRAFRDVNLFVEYPAVVNRRIYESLETIESGGRVPEEDLKMLSEIGYVDLSGNLTRAGRLVLLAWRYLKTRDRTPPIGISSAELDIMREIVELWKKAECNPEMAPTRKLIEERLKEGWKLKHYTIGLTLYQLEALGLIEEVKEEERLVLKLTREGELVYRESKGRPASSLAVKSLLEADCCRSPDEDWIRLAREEGLIGPGGPTGYGIALMRASREARRSILVTNLEVLILRRLPERRSIRRDDLVKSFPGQEEELNIALDKLEAKGLIMTCLGGRVVLTEVGSILKQAIIGVPTGVAAPVNPHVIKLLKAIKELRTEDIATLVNETKLDLETVKTALIIARACKFLGRGGSVTDEGELLLKAVDMLMRRAAHETLTA
ncbi:MAG: DUF505 domain-containing protein [Crenarchaeota archaeon]|nr:DUF505 domain-containing protein [Thermoproteota archaeon]